MTKDFFDGELHYNTNGDLESLKLIDNSFSDRVDEIAHRVAEKVAENERRALAELDKANELWQIRNEDLCNEVMQMCDFCVCGNPEMVVEHLRQYLMLVKMSHDERVPDEYRLNTIDDFYLPYMYTADKAGLTEHGGSVCGAWLTAKGKELLTRLNMSFTEFKEKLEGEHGQDDD